MSTTAAPDTRLVKLSQLTPDPDQPRKVFDDKSITELASSILEHGVIQPIEVRPNGSDTTFIITTGERRFRALSYLAEKGMDIDVPVIVRDTDAADLLARQVVENVQRQNMLPMEEARAYARLRDDQRLNQKQIASAVGKSQTYVGRRLSLLALDESLHALVDNGFLSIEIAIEAARVKDQEAVIAIIEEAKRDGWAPDINDISRLVHEQEKEVALDKAMKAAEAHGLTVFTRTDMHEENSRRRTEAAEKAEVGTDYEYKALTSDDERSFEPGTLGEAKLKRSDKGVLIHQAWDGTITCTPVYEEKATAHKHTERTINSGQDVDTGIRIPHDKRAAAIGRASAAWLREQDRLILQAKHAKADVIDFAMDALVITAGPEAMEVAARLLDVELETKTVSRWSSKEQKNIDVEVVDSSTTIQREVNAGGVRQLRALLALSMSVLDKGYYAGAREALADFRKEHDFVPFPEKKFVKEWEAEYIAKEEKKRAKAAAAKAKEAEATDDDEGQAEDGDDAGDDA